MKSKAKWYNLKQVSFSCLLALLLMSCSNGVNQVVVTNDTIENYPTVSYLKIKLDANGHLPSNPYIKEYKAGNKHIVFCGTIHLEDNRDTGNSMFKTIEKKFFEFMPTVIVNEGGDVSKKQYKSKSDAIMRDGEIGLSKILSDQLLIPIINGDMPDSLEFRALLKKYSMADLIAYVSTERCMWGFAGQGIKDSFELKKQYADFVQKYLEKRGDLRLNETERSFAFYQSNYERLLKRPFSLKTLEPFDSVSYFQTIGRASKEIRDQNLLNKIAKLLKAHDKVFVVFGGWHLLTCDPGLEQIINQYK
jgi:hypothetical protein